MARTRACSDLLCLRRRILIAAFASAAGYGARIVFNRSKLEEDFELSPYDAHGDGSEFEIRVIGPKIREIVKCIDRIEIVNETFFVQYARELLGADPEFSGTIKKIIDLVSAPSDDLLLIARKSKHHRP